MNTMKGMPGRIKVAGKTSAAGLKGAGHTGPKRAGPIGQKGGPHRANNQTGMGTTRSYRAASTGHPGRIERMIGHAKMSTEK